MPDTQTHADYRAGYPIFLDMKDRPVIVIGGGAVATRKVDTLLAYGAAVTVVAPEVTPSVAAHAEAGDIVWKRRAYETGDLEGTSIGFCACGDPAIDARVFEEAHAAGCLMNVVDVPQCCDFVVPSILRRGLLSIAVSTSGASCTESKLIRRSLEDQFDDSWEAYLDLMAAVRTMVKDRVSTSHFDRRPIFEACVRANWRERLAAGEQISVEDAYNEAVAAAKKGAPQID